MAPPPDHAPGSSEELNALVADCLAAHQEGGQSAVEALLANHAELASSARRRLEQLARSGLLGDETRGETPERLGEFRLLERLGAGGMGVVYRAVQESLGREVALKLIRPEQHYFPGARERFRREVEAVARLQHPGIVPVHTVGQQDGVPYFAMQLVEGCTLAQVLERMKGRSPEDLTGRDLLASIAAEIGEEPPRETPAPFASGWVEACLRVVRAMAEALEHAHRAGVVHRDLKPSNVMLTLEGRVMLLDFGLSSIEGASRLTQTGSAMGSVPYLPPEALAGESVELGVPGDVYSLGVTLYEALAVAPPFDGPGVIAIVQKVVEARPKPLRLRNPAVPPEAATVCAVAMERDSKRRYPSAEALAHDLTNVLARRPISARPTGGWLRARRWVQRHPGWATTAALALVVTTVGPTAFAWQAMKSADALAAENARTLDMLEKALEAVQASLVVLGGEDVRDVPHLARKQREVLERAVELYNELAAAQRDSGLSSPAGRRMSDLRAEALSVLGQVRGQLGLAEEAEAAWSELRSLAEERLSSEPDHPPAKLSLARAHLGLARLALDSGDTSRVEDLAALGRPATEDALENAKTADLSLSLAAIDASARFRAGRADDAIEALESALAVAERLVSAHPNEQPLRSRRASLRLSLGGYRFQLGDWAGAEEDYVAATAELEDLLETTIDLVHTKDSLVHAHLDLGQLYRNQGRLDEALIELERGVELQEDLARSFPDAEHRQFELVNALQSLGITLNFDDARRAEGHAVLTQAREHMEPLLASQPENVDRVSVMGMVLAGLGSVCFQQAAASPSAEEAEAHLEEALALCPEAIARYEEARALAPGDPELARALRRGHLGYADALLAAERWEDAAAQLRASAAVTPIDWLDLRILAGRFLRCASLTVDGGALVEEAFATLSRAADAGYTDLGDLEGSPLLAPLRELEGYGALRAQVAAAVEAAEAASAGAADG